MLNIHDFSQETVNSIIEVIEKSAIQEIKILTNASLEYKGFCCFCCGSVWFFFNTGHTQKCSSHLTGTLLTSFLFKDLKPSTFNCNTWIKHWKYFWTNRKILFKHLSPMVFAFIVSLTNQFKWEMLMVTVLWTALYLLSQMA